MRARIGSNMGPDERLWAPIIPAMVPVWFWGYFTQKDREMCAICGSTDPSVTCSVCEDMSPGSEILLKDVMRVCICAAGKTVPCWRWALQLTLPQADELLIYIYKMHVRA